MKYRPNRQSCSPQKGPPFRGLRSAVRQHAIRFRAPADASSDSNVSFFQEDDGSAHLRFLTVIASLPAPQRQTVELALFEGLSAVEIAARLEISQSAAERLLESGLKTVANAMRGPANEL
jgi:DNA-directed RNA polymerase specialized sigma24 family protein